MVSPTVRIGLWGKTITYINSLENGTIFTRKDLFQAVYSIPIFRSKETCVDHYRHYLTILKIVEHVGVGKYRKIKNIPAGLTSKIAVRLCYDKSWKSWFVETLDERIKLEVNRERRTRKNIS